LLLVELVGLACLQAVRRNYISYDLSGNRRHSSAHNVSYSVSLRFSRDSCPNSERLTHQLEWLMKNLHDSVEFRERILVVLQQDYQNERSMIYIDNLCEFIRLIVQNQDSGIFYPQNQDYVNTSQLVKEIKRTHGQRVALLPAFNWILKGLSHHVSTLNKLFSDLTYEKEMSSYPQSYEVANFRRSIEKTEKGN